MDFRFGAPITRAFVFGFLREILSIPGLIERKTFSSNI
jgi:hypothetical protein